MQLIRRARTVPPTAVDGLLGVGIAAAVLVGAWTGTSGYGADRRPLDIVAFLLAAALAAALTLRRRAPVAVLAGISALALTWFAVGYPGRLIGIALVIGCYTVAAAHGWRWGLLAAVLTLAVALTCIAIADAGSDTFTDAVPDAVNLTAVAFAFGSAAHSHRRRAAAIRALEVEQARQEARRRADAERLRIARDLHDTLGHALAAISVQAGVGVHVIDDRPAQAAAALRAIKQLSDDSLAEVSTILGLLRDGETAPAGSDGVDGAAARGVDGIAALLDTARAAGISADLRIDGEPRAIPAATELAAYRIVQESLTNIRRHAEADHATVTLAYEPRQLVVAVRDDGNGRLPERPPGHGINGMRERATALGGRLTVRPAPDRGVEVRCTLPLPEAL